MMMICGLAVMCMAFQAQPVVGQEITEDSSQQDTEDTSQETAEDPAQEPPTQEVPKMDKITGLHTTCESDRKVLLEWEGNDGAYGYKVYRKTGDGNYRLLGETKNVYYRDKTIAYGKIYDYKILPVSRDGTEGPEATIRLRHEQAVNIKTQKYTYKQMQTDMKELTLQYSDYCELEIIGKTVEGRNIYDVALGNPKAGNSLLVVSTLHAREYICSAVLMRELEYYLRNYNKSINGTTPSKLLDNIQIHYIVMANPDGVTISQTKQARWKANCRGVDLNRNFPAKKFVVAGKRGPEGYSGKKALTEPESKAIAALTRELQDNQNLLGVINYHAMGQIVFGDCSDKNIKSETQTMYKIARNLTGYSDAGGYSSGESSGGGSYREYVMNVLKIPSITIEMGCTYAPCAYWEYNSAYEKNKLVVLKIAEAL